MNRPGRESQDTVPWYRQFWPWFLIALPGAVVIASLITLFIANRHADDLVVDDYYREGLRINRELEKTQRARELNLAVDLHFRQGSVEAHLTGPTPEQTLELLLSHPLEADRDRRVKLQRVAPGVYRGAVRPTPGRWHWVLQPSSDDRWRLDGTVELKPQ